MLNAEKILFLLWGEKFHDFSYMCKCITVVKNKSFKRTSSSEKINLSLFCLLIWKFIGLVWKFSFTYSWIKLFGHLVFCSETIELRLQIKGWCKVGDSISEMMKNNWSVLHHVKHRRQIVDLLKRKWLNPSVEATVNFWLM